MNQHQHRCLHLLLSKYLSVHRCDYQPVYCETKIVSKKTKNRSKGLFTDLSVYIDMKETKPQNIDTNKNQENVFICR